jgi:hexokinase
MSYKGKSLSYSGDTRFEPEFFDRLQKEGVIGGARRAALQDFVFSSDVVIHEAGGLPLHTQLQTLGGLREELKRRIYVVHSPKVDPATGLRKPGKGESIDLLADDIFAVPENEDILAMRTVGFFDKLDLREILILTRKAKPVTYRKGEAIIRQGEPGDNFYVISSGEVEVTVKRDDDTVRRVILGKGSPFGEQALLEDGRSRNATVTALTDVRLLAFDRALFNELSAAEGVRASMEKVDANRQLLSNVSAFTKLPHRGMVEVCNIAETAAYSKGELLIKQGEPGDNFFIIRSGSVDVIDEATGRIIDTKTSGDVVGEIALLRDTPRTATVRAGSDKVEALVIKRADFDGIIAKYPYIRYYLEQLSEERLRNIVAQRRAAALSEAGQAVTEGEISAAIDWINRREGDIFTPDKRREITAKVLSMALVKGRRFLVVGPGMQDYLPILLARLGIDTTTIDTNPAVADFMSRLAEKFSLTGMIKSVSDYDAIKGGKFDYISMFAVLNNIAPSSDPFITDNLNSIRGLESSFDMREADRGRKIDYYAGLIRQACEAYILPALEQITEQLNENGTLFVNSPPFAASREIASRIDYMDMLDSALSTIGDGQGIRFARQDGVDVSGLSMVSAHLNEARDGAAYVKVVAAQRGKPEAAKLAAGDEASGTVTPGVFVNVVRNLMKVDRAAEERVIKGMDKAMDDGLAGRPSSLKMIPAYVGAATGEEEGDYFAIDVGGTNLRVLGVRLEKGKNPSPIGDAEKAVIPASIVNGGSAEDLFGFVVGTIKEYARKNSIDPKAGMKFGLTWSFPVEQTGVASGIHKEWTKGWNVSGVVGKDPVALLSAALEREGLGNVKILAMCNDTVGTLMFGDVGLILGTGTNAAFPVAVKDIGKFKGRTGLEFMAINSEWGNFDGAPTEAWDEILDDMSSNPGRQKLEKMISGMYLGEVARLIMNMLVSEGELFRGRNYRVITDDPKKPGEDGFTAGLMSAIEKVDPDKDPDLSGVATILAGIGITDTTPDDRRAVRNICGAVSQRAARISASALAAVIKKSGVLSRKDTCRVAIDGSVFKHYHRFRETMEGALVEIFGAKEAARIKLVTADDGSGIGAAIIAAVVDRSEGRAAPAAGPATIKPQPTDVADEVEDMAPDDPESGDEAVEAIGDILDLLRIHETRNLPDNYFDMTTDFGFKYRLMQAASRSMWIMGPWETKDTDPVRAVWRIDHSVLSEFREWLLEYAKVARSNAPAPAPADIKGRAAIKSLPEVISEYIDRMAPDKGPDAVPRKLLASETKAIWDSVNLLDAENIEIIIPQRVRPTGEATGRFLLTDSVKRTLDDIRKRHGRDSVKINEYGSQKDLLGILRNGDPAAKRIVITDGELAGEVQSLSGDQPDLFLNVRLYSMELPNGYGDMSANDKSVVQARALSIAILMRLYDKDRFSVRMILEGLLEGRLADGVDVSDFIDSITDPDTIKRIKYFLGRTVKLVETMGKQLRLLERFVWSAA